MFHPYWIEMAIRLTHLMKSMCGNDDIHILLIMLYIAGKLRYMACNAPVELNESYTKRE